MALFLLFTVNFAVPGQAQETERTPPSDSLDLIDAMDVDAREYAKEYEVSQDEASGQLNSQENLGALLGRISAVAGPRLAGSFLRHEPEFGGVVRVTGEQPLTGLDTLSGDAMWSRVSIEYGSQHSERDLVKAIEATLWAEISPNIHGVYFDPVIGEIVVLSVGGRDVASYVELALVTHSQLQGLPVSVKVTEEVISDAG
ncbi:MULTISPECIES: hypothetical protein [unclassified Arthrobacter]|uniref:hypothetical protein n=1 Tax=unclassified Arthrobacter TaxID=235627 RepID=UPI0014924CEF|nr:MULTISPECIES: hypothetical protein [unclassified Arthrobacter]MBE0009648.1 hypothetical protein [Arthrobacter sp. AET 35A]NOJ63400.1 hypothetical protein [Arthrobacter sp. 147(2020)]